MPYCKNDKLRTYVGDEPSPKGLGYCAHVEKENTIMKGLDGNIWIIKNGKWIRYNLNKLIKKIYKKLYNWWYKIASLGFYVVYKDKKVFFYKTKIEDSDNIKYIIWSGQSDDSLTFFIYYILQKLSVNKIEEFIVTKNISLYLVLNFNIFFKKSKLYTNKDYTLQYLEKINEIKIMNKLKKSSILKKYI
jgi:hypothetical protein